MKRLIAIGVVIIMATWYIISVLFPGPKKEKEEEKVLTPLDKLKKLINLEQDELARVIASISKIGDDLLNKHVENDITREIINQYRVYIDGYIQSATSFAEKFRKAENYLCMVSAEELEKDIKMLTSKVKEGKTVFEKTLKEKQDTIKDLETIKMHQDKKLVSLMEIQATLLSLQASIVSVETGDKNEKDAIEDMQTSISTLSQALDKTFEELEDEEVFKKQKVETV